MNKVTILCNTCNRMFWMSEEAIAKGVFIESCSGLSFDPTECINCQKKEMRRTGFWPHNEV